MSKTSKITKIIAIALVILSVVSFAAVPASAASYSTGTYMVAASNGSNVRSGAGTKYSVVGAASYGTTFTVSRISGSWGYTGSIRCTNGTRSGWVCLDYCRYKGSGNSNNNNNSNRSTYNDVFASVYGSGCSLSQARRTESTSFSKGTFVYVWAFLHDANDNLYKSYGNGTCNMTLSIYRPNGSCAFSYTYNNCDCNWIGQKLDVAGTWKIQSKITGSLTGTNTRTITVRNTAPATVSPSSVSLNYRSVTLGVGSSKYISATVYPSNATNKSVTWSSSNNSVASVSGGKITAKAPGTATITARTANGKSASCTVYVKGISINPYSVYNVYAGDIIPLGVSSYGVSSSRKWTSSNSSVLSVNSSGMITAKKAGTATVTVRTSDGYSSSITITVKSKNVWRTGYFDTGYVAKGYTTVTLNKNRSSARVRIYTYDMLGLKSSGKMHVTLRSNTGAWIWEGDITSGDTLKLGNDHSQYRIYIAKKQYPNTIIGNADNFDNTGKCNTWAIECTSYCYI